MFSYCTLKLKAPPAETVAATDSTLTCVEGVYVNELPELADVVEVDSLVPVVEEVVEVKLEAR